MVPPISSHHSKQVQNRENKEATNNDLEPTTNQKFYKKKNKQIF